MTGNADGQLCRPDYGGACITEVVPALLDRRSADPPSLARLIGVEEAEQVVLLVIDGLGWEQLQAFATDAPTITAMTGGPITSVAPTTTATALTSIATASPPARHGVLGYRIWMGHEVLNVLKWTTPSGDVRRSIPPASIQPLRAFRGEAVPVVSRSEFAGSGFTDAHLPGLRLAGWRMPSSLVVEISRLTRAGEPFVYAYYDGIDKIAHETGIGEHYRAELRAVDQLVAEIFEVLPKGTALALTADHGQVEVPGAPIVLDPSIASELTALSGEGRFRWLHCHRGAAKEVAAAADERYGDVAWVRTRDELIDGGYFGGPIEPSVAARLGDVALLAREPVAFLDPADTGELRLVARHGSLTSAEVFVPFLGSTR